MREDTITQCLQEINSIMREDVIIQCLQEINSIMGGGHDHTVSSGDKHSIMREDVIIQCLQEINTALWERTRSYSVFRR